MNLPGFDPKLAVRYAAFALPVVALWGQATVPQTAPAIVTTNPSGHILGVIPNYQTVEDPNRPVTPLTKLEKFKLALKEATDPFNIVGAALGAGLSQADDAHPKYGQGGMAYTERFAAATADMTAQSFLSDGVLAPLFHQDPRYFRKGPSSSIPSRILYSMTRPLIGRTDSRHKTFNFAQVLGMAMGIALSNAYYPPSSVSGSVYESRLVSSMTGAVLSNFLPEFWPDVRDKIFHRRKKSGGSSQEESVRPPAVAPGPPASAPAAPPAVAPGSPAGAPEAARPAAPAAAP